MERRTKKANNAYANLIPLLYTETLISPATTLYNNSTRRHLSTSSLAQIVAKLAQFETGKIHVLYLPNEAFTGRSN